MYYCNYLYCYSNTLTSLIPHVWQKTTSCVRLSLLPVVLSDSTLWLQSASRDMHILIHHLLPTGLPAVRTCASVTSADVQADRLRQENKPTVLHDVQYKLKGSVSGLSTWTCDQYLKSHDFSLPRLDCLSFVKPTAWAVAATYHLCNDLCQETDIKVWTRAEFCMEVPMYVVSAHVAIDAPPTGTWNKFQTFSGYAFQTPVWKWLKYSWFEYKRSMSHKFGHAFTFH